MSRCGSESVSSPNKFQDTTEVRIKNTNKYYHVVRSSIVQGQDSMMQHNHGFIVTLAPVQLEKLDMYV
jgi:hypothetical protein